MSHNQVRDLGAHVAAEQDAMLERAVPNDETRELLGRMVAERRSSRQRPGRKLWVTSAWLAPAVLVGLWLVRGWLPLESDAPLLTFTVGERPGVLNAWESAPNDERLAVDFSDGTSVILAPAARARVVDVKPRGAELVLESGRASVHVVPRSGDGSHYVVRTGPFAVEVKGTRFDVAWDAASEEFSLQLYEGRVNVVGCGFGAGREVPAGYRVRSTCGRPGFELQMLTGNAAGGDEPKHEPGNVPPPVMAPVESPAAPVERAPSGPEPRRSDRQAAARSSWQELARNGLFERAYEVAAASGFERECTLAKVEDVMLLGDAARHAGQSSQARHAYATVRERAPRTASAARAAFALGRLSVDDDPEHATRWFEQSLSESPQGPLAQAARDRVFEAAVRNGDPKRIREFAKSYLADSPEGPHADRGARHPGPSGVDAGVSRLAERLGRWARAAAIGCLWLVVSVPAFGQSPPQVMLSGAGSRELGRKLRAELLYAGFTVVDAPPSHIEPSANAAPERAGDALIRITSDQRVELHVAGGEERSSFSQALHRRDGEAQSFALRVVEELRARLVDLGISVNDVSPAEQNEAQRVDLAPPRVLPIPTVTEAPPASVDTGASARDRPSSTSLWLRGGVGGVWAAGGIGSIVEGAVGASLELESGVVVSVSALVPLNPGEVSAPEGEADVYIGSVAVELGLVQQLSPSWRVNAGAGAGLLVVSSEAEAQQAFVAQNDTLFAGTYYAQAGATWSLTEAIRIRAGALLGWIAPRPVLRFDQRDVASFGPGFVALVLNAEVGWALVSETSP